MLTVSLNVMAKQEINNVNGDVTSYKKDSLKWFVMIRNSHSIDKVEITNKDEIVFASGSYCTISLEYSDKKLSDRPSIKNLRGKVAKCTFFGEKFDLHSVCYEAYSEKECNTFESKEKQGVSMYIRGF